MFDTCQEGHEIRLAQPFGCKTRERPELQVPFMQRGFPVKHRLVVILDVFFGLLGGVTLWGRRNPAAAEWCRPLVGIDSPVSAGRDFGARLEGVRSTIVACSGR